MSLDEGEDFFCPPAGNTEGAGEEEFFASPLAVVPPARAVGHVGRPREPVKTSTFGAWLVQEASVAAPGASSSSSFTVSTAHRSVIGVSQCRWTFRPAAPAAETTVAGGPGAGVSVLGAADFGVLSYELLECWRFPLPVPLDDAFCTPSLISLINVGLLCKDVVVQGTALSFQEFAEQSVVSFDRVIGMQPRLLLSALCSTFPAPLFTVPLGRRISWEHIVRDEPARSFVNRWRRLRY